MLYDPRWELTTNTKMPSKVSVEGLIAWLETQDPTTPYNYGDNNDCLLARYFRASGFHLARCTSHRFCYSRFALPRMFSTKIPIEMNGIAVEQGWTYGAALARARMWF
jgi:hypothetical protein